MLKKFAYKTVAAGLLVSLSGTASAALSDQWYIGIGGGVSQLQPEASNPSIDVDDKAGQVGTIFFGKDFDSRSSGQFQLYSLGEASFDDGQSTASYVGGDASLLYRFFDSRDRRERGAVFGASFYGRFGFGFLNRDSDLPLDDDAPVYFGAGAGMETYFTNNLGMRLEALYHETDTATATLTLITRFGGHRSRPPVMPPAVAKPKPAAVTSPVDKPAAVPLAPPVSTTAPDPDTATLPGSVPGSSESPLQLPTLGTPEQASEPALQNPDSSFPDVEIMGNTQETTAAIGEAEPGDSEAVAVTPTPPAPPVQAPLQAPAPEPLQAPLQEPLPTSSTLPAPVVPGLPNVDSDGDGVNDDKDRCPDSTIGYPVSTRGCPQFAGLLPDVTFRDGSAEFDESSFAVLDKLVQTLKDYPDTYIEIVAHTDNSGTELEQSALTRQRLRSVGLYLVNRGISQERLLLRSFGGKRPAFDNATADGRRRNNRIEVFENP